MANFVNNSKAMGYANAVQGLAPIPLSANRIPTVNDRANDGQLWIIDATGAVYICAGTVNGVTTWNLISNTGGTGVFNSITTTVGPNALAGVTTLANGLVVTAGGATVTAGNLAVTAGTITGTTIRATGDAGGVAATNSLTNATQAPGAIANTLVGTIGGQTNAGYIKMYVGATAVYVPYFTAP